MNTIKKYTSRSLWLAALLTTTLMLGCDNNSSNYVGVSPTVLGTTPADTDTDVALNVNAVVIFSEEMDETSITTESFTMKDSSETEVIGTVLYDAESKSASFDPETNFIPSTTYTATLSTAVKSAVGVAIEDDFSWSFTSGTASDEAAPVVVSTNPLDAATDVPVNQNVAATFNESLDPATVTDTTFTLKKGSTLVPGVVSYSSKVVVFNPNVNLDASTEYTATLTTGIKDVAGNGLATVKEWSFTSGATPDTTAPVVLSTNPLDTATDVSVNQNVTVAFSEALDPASVTSSSFTLKNGDTSVSGVVSYSSNEAVFNPTADLTAETEYTATLTTDIQDLAGNALETSEVWSFTTGVTPDETAPIALSTNPLDEAIDVPVNQNVTATFNEALDPASVNTLSFTLQNGTTSVPGVVSYSNKVAVFNPTDDLTGGVLYNATLTTDIKDLAGNALATAKEWSFTTGTAPDTTAPSVVSTNPADAATVVPVDRSVTATFSESLDPISVDSLSFTLKDGTTSVPGVISYSDKVAVLNPDADLAFSTEYTATLTTAITDVAGNALAADEVWTFTTDAGPAIAQGPAAVDLQTAGNFVILTKTGITNVHTSAIVGDIGASPITAAAMDNVFCSEITGFIYGADAAYTGSGDSSCFKGVPADNTLVANAVGHMEVAYTDAAGRTTPDFTELYAGDLSGQTLVPGLYKWGNDVLINAGDVTLDGGPNDVWIFQIAGNITQASSTSVFLTGGALAKNVFWQVGGGVGVDIDTGATFQGVILAIKAINVKTGATVNGRLLSQTEVTLQQNAVTQPAE